ncbi:MAG: hypothetical protein CME68_05195 [Halobacteriovoraceae bacterium]|nr:hypothetical protein [Halobacteriovoraceae bacterium]|tara:strand:- start:1791 stop:2570 length:780 start_codon:yes stop_codon:yes gene_type:complete
MVDQDLSEKLLSSIKKDDFKSFSSLLDSLGPLKIIMAIEDLGDELISSVFGEIDFINNKPLVNKKSFINNFNISQDSMLFGDTQDTSPNVLLFYGKTWERKLVLEFFRIQENNEHAKILIPPALDGVLNPAITSYIEEKSIQQASIFAQSNFINDNGNVFFIEAVKIIIEKGEIAFFFEIFDLISDKNSMAKVLRKDPTFWARIWNYISFNSKEGEEILGQLISRSIIPRLDDQVKYHSVNLPNVIIENIEEAQKLLKE